MSWFQIWVSELEGRADLKAIQLISPNQACISATSRVLQSAPCSDTQEAGVASGVYLCMPSCPLWILIGSRLASWKQMAAISLHHCCRLLSAMLHVWHHQPWARCSCKRGILGEGDLPLLGPAPLGGAQLPTWDIWELSSWVETAQCAGDTGSMCLAGCEPSQDENYDVVQLGRHKKEPCKSEIFWP